jgi:hypothetical protein
MKNRDPERIFDGLWSHDDVAVALQRLIDSRKVKREDLVECPGEAHELDCTFNPGSQGPYGPGYHHCDYCDDAGWITEEWELEIRDWEAECKRQAEQKRKEAQRELEQLKIVEKLKSGPRQIHG